MVKLSPVTRRYIPQSALRTPQSAFPMIVTIDGPAGAGKSSIARRLAERLGFQFLDTGAMYRAVALAALRRGLGDADAEAIARLADEIKVEMRHERTILDGEDVSAAIRTSDVSAAVYLAADNVAVRRRMVELQRQIAGERDTVTEGRDQGTVAFPRAECKIFLTASPEVRALRRHGELAARGERVTLDEVLAQQADRDRRDAERPVGALVKAADAVEVWTDGLSPDEVIDRLEAIVRGVKNVESREQRAESNKQNDRLF
jgi:cytidylate kinase